jgi:hypothetical protein
MNGSMQGDCEWTNIREVSEKERTLCPWGRAAGLTWTKPWSSTSRTSTNHYRTMNPRRSSTRT